MDRDTIYYIAGAVACLFGIYAAAKAVSPWWIDLKLTESQFNAVAKRAADALEKMSIGSFLYWFFQNQSSGLIIGFIMMALSFAITIKRN